MPLAREGFFHTPKPPPPPAAPSRRGATHEVRIRARRHRRRERALGGARPGHGGGRRALRARGRRPLPVVGGRLPRLGVRLRRRGGGRRAADQAARLEPVGVRAPVPQPIEPAELQRSPRRDRAGRGSFLRDGRPMKVSGAQALFKALEGEGVDTIFGIPGGAILPAYDPLLDSSIRHVLCRHEQGAGHAAEGYAWATGKVGVALATSGPGGCNLVTAIADAKMDSVPIVCITGQVPTPVVGNDAFQEADITGITMPITKHNILVKDPALIPETVREAFHIASTGRPGPVLIDLPKDVLLSETTWSWPERGNLPGYKPTTKGNQRQVGEAVKLIMAAERPVLYVGGGVIKADAHAELAKLATVGRLPVVTTLMAP